MPTRNPLLPGLSEWNDGRGVTVLDWLATFARSDHALGYAALLWPTFIEFEGYILRDDFNLGVLRSWEQSKDSSRTLIERCANLIFISDLFLANQKEEWSPLMHQRCDHIGRMLTEIYALKLERDFPERIFQVRVWEEEEEELVLSFWQA